MDLHDRGWNGIKIAILSERAVAADVVGTSHRGDKSFN